LLAGYHELIITEFRVPNHSSHYISYSKIIWITCHL